MIEINALQATGIAIMVLVIAGAILNRIYSNRDISPEQLRAQTAAAHQQICDIAIDPKYIGEFESWSGKMVQACRDAGFTATQIMDVGPTTKLLAYEFPKVPLLENLPQCMILVLRKLEDGSPRFELVAKPTGNWDPIWICDEESPISEIDREGLWRLINLYHKKIHGPFEAEVAKHKNASILDFP